MIMTNTLTLPNAPNSTSQVEMMNAHDVSNKNIEHTSTSTSLRIICRKLKFQIDIDENILKPMHDKMSERNCRRIVQKIWNNYFENLNQSGRCQLIFEMVKILKFRETMRILRLRTSEKGSERTIFLNLFDAYKSIGSQSHNKDANATRWVLTSTIMRKEMEKTHMICKTSKSLRINRTTLVKALVR